MLKFPRKEKGKREKKWKAREKREKKEGEKGFRIEWGGIQEKKKELCKKNESATRKEKFY